MLGIYILIYIPVRFKRDEVFKFKYDADDELAYASSIFICKLHVYSSLIFRPFLAYGLQEQQKNTFLIFRPDRHDFFCLIVLFDG